MCLAQGPQRSDAGEARTRGPSVSSQALYHWATALPQTILYLNGVPEFCFQKLIKLLIFKTSQQTITKAWNISVFIISAVA